MSLEEALKPENIAQIRTYLLAEIAPNAKSKDQEACWTNDYCYRKIDASFDPTVLELSGNWDDDMAPEQIIRDGIDFLVNGNANTHLGRYFHGYKQGVGAYVREIKTSAIEQMNITVQDLFVDPQYLHFSYKKGEIATLKLAKIEAIKWLAGLVAKSNLENKAQFNNQLEAALHACSSLSFEEKLKAFFSKMWLLSTDFTLFYRRSSHNNVSQYFDNAWIQLQLIAQAGNQYDFSVNRALKVWSIAIATGVKMTSSSPLRVAMLVHKMFDTWTGMLVNPLHSVIHANRKHTALVEPIVDGIDTVRKAILPFAEGALLLFLVPLSLIPTLLMPVFGAGTASIVMTSYTLFTGVKSMFRYITNGALTPEAQAQASISSLIQLGRTNPAQIIGMMKYQHPELMSILTMAEVHDMIVRELNRQKDALHNEDEDMQDVDDLNMMIGQHVQPILNAQPQYIPAHHVPVLPFQAQQNDELQSDTYKLR